MMSQSMRDHFPDTAPAQFKQDKATNWLPRKVHLDLTLLSVLTEAPQTEIHKPDKNGNPVPSTIPDVLQELILKAID